MIDPAGDQMAAEAQRLSALLDKGIRALVAEGAAAAEAERAYRLGKSEAWARCPTEDDDGKWTAARREAWVDADSAGLRDARDLADSRVQSARQAVKGRGQQVSLLQSLLAAHRAEAGFAAHGPGMGP